MLNIDAITDILAQRIKTVQSLNQSCTPKIAPDLVKTVGSNKRALTSINEASNYITPDAVYEILYLMRKHVELNFPIWDITTNYQTGDFVNYDDGTHNFIYIARQNNVGQTPAWDSDFWETNLSNYLRNAIWEAAQNCIATYIQNVTAANDIAVMMEAKPLFSGLSTPKVVTYPMGADEFIGMRIICAPIQHIQIQFTQIGIFCTGAQTLPLYLYHSSQTEPIAQFQLDLLPTDVNKFVWKKVLDLGGEPIDAVMNFVGNSHNTSGVFYFGYYRSDLVNTSPDNVKGYNWKGYKYAPIYSYSGDWQYWFNSISPIKFSQSELNKPNIPSIGEFFSGGNYDYIAPFNIKMIAQCNYTYPIEENPQLFDEYLLYATVERILTEMNTGVRKNEQKSKLAEEYDRMMLGVFMDNKELKQGILTKKALASKNLTSSLSMLDDVCFNRLNFKQNF